MNITRENIDELNAVLKVDIEKDDGGFRLGGDADRLLPAHGDEELVALLLQRLVKHLEVRWVVIDEEDAVALFGFFAHG